MKKKVILKRILHNGEWRYGIFFGFDDEINAMLRTVFGARFSKANGCWHVPYDELTLKELLSSLKGLADVDISAVSWKSAKTETINNEANTGEGTGCSIPSGAKSDITAEEINQPRTIQRIAGVKKDESTVYDKCANNVFGPVEFRISENDKLLVIKFLGEFNREWIREMRSYGELEYDRVHREWFLPWTKLTCDSLADYFTNQGVAVNVTRQVVSDDLIDERRIRGDEIRSKPLGRKALDGLDMLTWFLDDNRYSTRTRESYVAMLEFFFRYFSPKEPGDISEDDISRFLYDFIIRLGYSASYQNQMVSAVKTYYSISGKGNVDPEILERPRRRRSLPKVFSKEEVTKILSSTGNIKHKMLLWLIYSCGLRRSEVTNLRLGDLDRDRGILHIREGKGRVDRFVPVSGRVWGKLDEYLTYYRPKGYLFEGQSGGKYSSESVYRVFKQALVSAGIKKEVGVHSLRHSYATHLHENGLDIRYIQELLGHKSTRTTEIYTHVSRRNLIAVRSPIDDLDLK